LDIRQRLNSWKAFAQTFNTQNGVIGFHICLAI
jgi:hypothetical protein